jgi:DNA-binding transcriptional regulator YhcF (GntR family)
MELADMVRVDLRSPVPPFQQVRDQIGDAIERAALLPAVRLPPVRQLASELGLAANTVARSYRELELAGLVETRGRYGTFVSSGPSPTRKRAARDARTFARRMRDLGIGVEESLLILRREAERLADRPSSPRPRPPRPPRSPKRPPTT